MKRVMILLLLTLFLSSCSQFAMSGGGTLAVNNTINYITVNETYLGNLTGSLTKNKFPIANATNILIDSSLRYTSGDYLTSNLNSLYLTGGSDSYNSSTVLWNGKAVMWNENKNAFRSMQVNGFGNNYMDYANLGSNSVAFGLNCQASGSQSICSGGGNEVNTANSGTFGTSNVIDGGTSSYAFGSGHNLSSSAGNNNAVFGQNHIVSSGNGHFLAGTANTADGGSYCASGGFTNTCSGTGNAVFGALNTADGLYSTALGGLNNIDGNFAVGLGSSNTVTASSSQGIGNTNVISQPTSMALGNKITIKGGGGTSMGIGWGVEVNSTYSTTIGVGWDNAVGQRLYNDIDGAIMMGTYSNLPTLTIIPYNNAGGVGTVGHLGIATSTPDVNYLMDVNGSVLFEDDVDILGTINVTQDLIVNNNVSLPYLNGTGNAMLCIDSSGTLYRGNLTSC